MTGVWRRWWKDEKGAALLEVAITLPLLLLVSVSIFEFGRAYQTWQVLTNAAREGARVAILPNVTDDQIADRVNTFLAAGQLSGGGAPSVSIDHTATVSYGPATAAATKVTVNYPFQFMVLQPVAQLVVNGSMLGTPFTMAASTTMRNE